MGEQLRTYLLCIYWYYSLFAPDFWDSLFCLKHLFIFLSKQGPLRMTTVPNHHLYYTSDFHHTPKQCHATINAGSGSLVQIDTVEFCSTNQCCTRATPSHTIISVADLEVKFNFPLQKQTPVAPWKATSEFRSHFRLPAQARQDIITYEKGYMERGMPIEREGFCLRR